MIDAKFNALTLCSMVTLLATGQAFAHTGVRDIVPEGQGSYNGFTITHGCGALPEGGIATSVDQVRSYPVLGQSAVFPIGQNVVWRDAAGTVLGVGADPASIIAPDATGAPALMGLSVTGYASFSSAFTTAQEIVNSLGNIQGLLWKDGAMEPKLNTITPFKITAPVIADPCVSQLKVRIGVVNYCDIGKNAANDARGPYQQPKDAFGRTIPDLVTVDPVTFASSIQSNVNGAPVFVTLKNGNGDNNRADWWFTAPYGGSAVYTDADVLQPTYWTTMIVANSAADVAACGAAPHVVSVEPTGAAFDEILSGPNTRPFTAGNSNL